MQFLAAKSAGQEAPCETPVSAARRRGVLLINLGTPESPDVPSVRRYLAEFLSDPAVIKLPTGFGWLTGALGHAIARFRAPASAKMYKTIWSDAGSPLKTITEDQTAALEAILPRGWSAFYAMRYGSPSIASTLEKIEAAGIDELTVVPMYPQYSEPSTGTALTLLYEHLKMYGRRMHITIRTAWHDDHGYINAQAELLRSFAQSNDLTPDDTYLLFSTHGMPVSYIRDGDPYQEQVERTVALVGNCLGWPADRMSLSYQSRLGPVEWLRPYTEAVIADLASNGVRRIMVCPISFTADCLETLEEIDVRFRVVAEASGTELFLCPAPNAYGPFITALKHITLGGCRPMTQDAPPLREFHTSAKEAAPRSSMDDLVMVGVSQSGRLRGGHAPTIAHTDQAGFREIKTSQADVPDVLRAIASETGLGDVWLWNTCNRFELYFLDRTASTESERTAIVDTVRRHLFGTETAANRTVNVLRGESAWRHLLRTAAGLNGQLPGERDVLEQLQAAHRLATHAGTAGMAADSIINDVVQFERSVRSDTDWGRFAPDFCSTALAGVLDINSSNFSLKKFLVIGGSTTSAAVLRALRERFVPPSQLTLIYRGHRHGGQIKILRKAIGPGRRIRVQSYEQRSVRRSIADADVVIFGVDRREPLLTAEQFDALGNGRKSPLTIVDFNLFGSTRGLEAHSRIRLFSLEKLNEAVASQADEICRVPEFARAVEAVEALIAQHPWPAGNNQHASNGAIICEGDRSTADWKPSLAPQGDESETRATTCETPEITRDAITAGSES